MVSTSIQLVLLAASVATAVDAPGKAKPVRVVIVSGEDYAGHRWKETGPAIRKILEKDARMDVRLVEDAEFLASPALLNYDVIFLHFKNYKPLANAAMARENLVNCVKQGKGLVVFHFACGAFEDWPEYADLAGRVWDRNIVPPHDPKGPFQVKIVQPDHPITRGMTDFPTDDELYFCYRGDRPIEVLAAARSKVTGKDHAMAFVFEYGKGRVFHTPLGHDVRAIEMPGVAELIRRGCLWTAKMEP